jgi:dCMP deaminase
MEVGCLREQLKIIPGERHELCRGLHAEQNAIIQAAYHGVTINGAHLYCTHLPCSICIKMLINAGIEKVFYLEGYPDDLSIKMIDESSIIIGKVNYQRTEKDVSAKPSRTVPSRNSGIKPKEQKGPRNS